MTDKADKALLPAGLSDVLAPHAAFEASVLERLMAYFAGHGYDRVEPPLIEFEECLLTGIGEGMGEQTFRIMDPESHKMMGVRADMTPQIARIAAARLSKTPRPLRLSYAGDVLRVKGSQLRPERQFTQVGAELIGAVGEAEPAADAEVIVMAAGALIELGVTGLSCDLGLPTLVSAVCGMTRKEIPAKIRQALDRKDAADVADMKGAFGDKTTQTLSALLESAGPASETLKALAKLGLKEDAGAGLDLLSNVVALVEAAAGPDLALTIDPVEDRGFEYHTGVTFTFFAKGVRGELGNGGRYQANGHGEAATGFTLFMDTVLRALAQPESPKKIYLPFGTPPEEAAGLRAQGRITVAGLKDDENAAAEAARLGCTHLLAGDKIKTI